MESDLCNKISWVLKSMSIPWKFQYLLKEIRDLSSSIKIVFKNIIHSPNDLADYLAKQGVDRVVPPICVLCSLIILVFKAFIQSFYVCFIFFGSFAFHISFCTYKKRRLFDAYFLEFTYDLFFFTTYVLEL